MAELAVVGDHIFVKVTRSHSACWHLTYDSVDRVARADLDVVPAWEMVMVVCDGGALGRAALRDRPVLLRLQLHGQYQAKAGTNSTHPSSSC